MIHYDTYFIYIQLSYLISNLIVTLSTMSIGTPRFFTKFKTWLLFALGFFLLGLIFLPLQKYIELHAFMVCSFTFFLIRLLYSDTIAKCFGMLFYILSLSMGAELICIYSFYTYLHLKAYADFAGNNLYMLAGITFTNMSMLLLTATAPAVWWMIKAYRHSKMLFLYCLFPIYQYITFTVCMCLFDKPSLWMIIVGNIFLILGFIVDFILLSSLTNLIHKKQRQEELELINKQQQQEYECYIQIQKQLHEHRLLKHDFANQLSTIYALISNQAPIADIETMITNSCNQLKQQNIIEKNRERGVTND
jgi:hypothetical protein